MRYGSIIFMLATILYVKPAPILADAATKLVWAPGWDDTTQPLDYGYSFVKFGQSANGRLQITYHLQGARPNTAHTVGLHVYRCILSFGQYLADACGLFTRDGNWSWASPVELGVINTDQNGNGNLEVNVQGIAPGDYTMSFHTRFATKPPTDSSNCGGSSSPCSVIYKSPGPFGVGSVEITVP
jgi:hypothetical protein